MVNTFDSTIGTPLPGRSNEQPAEAANFSSYIMPGALAQASRSDIASTAQTDGTKPVANKQDKPDVSRPDAGKPDAGDSGVNSAKYPYDAMRKVDSILDVDIPRLNKAHDLDGAKKAYEQAIELAKTIPPASLIEVERQLKMVHREKANETNPAAQRDLANKEADLYTITRLKDACLGNMALWYYRQGKVEEGNEKLIEASGADPAKAHDLRKMSPTDLQNYGTMITTSRLAPPILGDVNFFRQLAGIQKNGMEIPAVFTQVHQALLQAKDHSNHDNSAGHGTEAPKPEAPRSSKATTGGAVSDQPPDQPPAKPPASEQQQPPAPGEVQHKPVPGAAKPDNNLSALSEQDLLARLDSAQRLGPPALDATKALFDEAIKRTEDPRRSQFATTALQTNLNALESGKDASGKPLDAAERTALQVQNVRIVALMTMPADLHSQYANYLGDGRLNDPRIPIAQMQDGVNQIKSMDREQRLAIAAADKVDIGLLHRADAALDKDRKEGTGDQTTLDQCYQVMHGGKTGEGQRTPGLLDARVMMRDKLAALYLMQSQQLKANGAPLDPTQKPVIDELLKPQEALKLVADSRKAYQDINGAGAHDVIGEAIFAQGNALHPEVFKELAQGQKNDGSSALSNFWAVGGSLAGSAAMRLAFIAGAEILTEGKFNPTVLNAVSNVAGVGAGIATHRIAYQVMTGQSESWTDSIVHGGVAGATPMIFNAAVGRISETPALEGALNARFAEIGSESVLARTAKEMGGNPTFESMAQVFRKSGLPSQAAQLEAMGARPIAEASSTELSGLNKSLNLTGAKGRDALIKIIPNAQEAMAPQRTLLARLGNKITSMPARTLSGAKDMVWDNRFYRIGPNSVTSQAASEAGSVDAAAGAAKTNWLSDYFPNIRKVDPMTASVGQLQTAGRLGRYTLGVAAALPATAFYNSSNAAYENWWKGRTYVGEDGKDHTYSLADAVIRANIGAPGESLIKRVENGTIGQSLFSGFVLGGQTARLGEAVPGGLGSVAKSGWTGLTKYGFSFSNLDIIHGWAERSTGKDRLVEANHTLDMIKKPLQDYPPSSPTDK